MISVGYHLEIKSVKAAWTLKYYTKKGNYVVEKGHYFFRLKDGGTGTPLQYINYTHICKIGNSEIVYIT